MNEQKIDGHYYYNAKIGTHGSTLIRIKFRKKPVVGIAIQFKEWGKIKWEYGRITDICEDRIYIDR